MVEADVFRFFGLPFEGVEAVGGSHDDGLSDLDDGSDAKQLFVGREVVAPVVSVEEDGRTVLLLHEVETTEERTHPHGVAITQHGEEFVVADAERVVGVVGVVAHVVGVAFGREDEKALHARGEIDVAVAVVVYVESGGHDGFGAAQPPAGRDVAQHLSKRVAQQDAAVVVGLPDAALPVAVQRTDTFALIDHVVFPVLDDDALQSVVAQHGPHHSRGTHRGHFDTVHQGQPLP